MDLTARRPSPIHVSRELSWSFHIVVQLDGLNISKIDTHPKKLQILCLEIMLYLDCTETCVRAWKEGCKILKADLTQLLEKRIFIFPFPLTQNTFPFLNSIPFQTHTSKV